MEKYHDDYMTHQRKLEEFIKNEKKNATTFYNCDEYGNGNLDDGLFDKGDSSGKSEIQTLLNAMQIIVEENQQLKREIRILKNALGKTHIENNSNFSPTYDSPTIQLSSGSATYFKSHRGVSMAALTSVICEMAALCAGHHHSSCLDAASPLCQ